MPQKEGRERDLPHGILKKGVVIFGKLSPDSCVLFPGFDELPILSRTHLLTSFHKQIIIHLYPQPILCFNTK